MQTRKGGKLDFDHLFVFMFLTNFFGSSNGSFSKKNVQIRPSDHCAPFLLSPVPFLAGIIY